MSALAPPAKRLPRWLRLALAMATVTIIFLVGWLELYPLWSANTHLTAAKTALTRFDFPLAETHLKQTLHARPDHSEASYLLAQVYRRTERYPEAREQLKVARKLAWADEYLKLEELMMDVQERGTTSGYLNTIRLYVDAAHPEDRLLYEAWMRGLLNSYQLPDAERVLNRWCDRYPDDWYPHYQRGRVREVSLSQEPALADYREALRLNPDHADVRRRIADLLIEARRDLEEARELYEVQLKRWPSDGEAEAGLAIALDQLGRTPEAITHAAAAVQLLPNSSRTLFLQAGLIRPSDPAKAYELAKRAEAASRDLPAIPLFLSQVANQLGQPEAAQRHLERYRVLDEQFRRLSDLLNDVRAKPHDAEIRCQIGELTTALGRGEEGMYWYHSAINEDPKHVRSHRLLAEYYERTRSDAERLRYHRQMVQQLSGGKK